MTLSFVFLDSWLDLQIYSNAVAKVALSIVKSALHNVSQEKSKKRKFGKTAFSEKQSGETRNITLGDVTTTAYNYDRRMVAARKKKAWK